MRTIFLLAARLRNFTKLNHLLDKYIGLREKSLQEHTGP